MIIEFNDFNNSFEYEMINEANVQDIYTKYYSEIDEDEFYDIVYSDPTSKFNDNTDNIKKISEIKKIGQYSKWLLKLFLNRKLKLEDLYKAKKYLILFDMLKKKNILKKDGINSDINKIKTLPLLYNLIKPYEDADEEDLFSNNDLEKKIKTDETQKIYEDDNWLVLIPKTHRSACYYGKNTQWCTAANDDPSMFDYYNDKGDILININKQKNEKFQFHFETCSLMDEEDSPIYGHDFFKKYNNLHNFYNEYFQTIDKQLFGYIINLLDGIALSDDKKYLLFDDWSYFSDLFDVEYEEFIKDLLSGLAYERFEIYDGEYGGYYDVDKDSLSKILKIIQKYIISNKKELDVEFEPENFTDIESVYDFCENEYELSDLKNDIDVAYCKAKSSANESEAYSKVQDAIINFFKCDENSISWDDDNKTYKMLLSNENIITLDEYIDKYDNDELDEDLTNLYKIKYDEPYNGYDGDIIKEYFGEEIINRLNDK